MNNPEGASGTARKASSAVSSDTASRRTARAPHSEGADGISGRYRPRSHFSVDAWQVDFQVTMPAWLRQEISEGRGKHVGGPAPYLAMRTVCGMQQAQPGNWIVRHLGGKISLFTDEAFAAAFEPVD